MSEIPPRDNPLLNSSDPQRPGYYLPPQMGLPPMGPTVPAGNAEAVGSKGAAQDGVPVPPPAAATGQTAAMADAVKPGGPPKPSHKQENTVAGAIDTIEAVIIALILALTFRAFVVEAFVIPTGSMAPTLLGAHFEVVCPECGYHFTEGASLDWQYNPAEGGLPTSVRGRGNLDNSTFVPAPEMRYCPNCGYGINVRELPGNPVIRGRGENAVGFPWANNGDRILVLKYLYSVREPQRWDVIVFKEPQAHADNYIKRLIGLPGETLEIVGGDVFIRPPAGPGEAELPMSVARKPRHVQDAVWQLVYDNDYFPRDAGQRRDAGVSFVSPWQGEKESAAEWKTSGPVVAYGGKGEGRLGFHARDWYFYNVRGYNNDVLEGESPDAPPSPTRHYAHQVVNDLHLETIWQPQEQGAANLAITLGPSGNRFRVTWNQPGTLSLERWVSAAADGAGRFETVEGALVKKDVPAVTAGQWHKVVMNNVDHAIQFYIDGREVLHFESPWMVEQAHAQARKPVEMPEVALEVSGACLLGHLKLMRDVYYTDYNLAFTSPDPRVAFLHPELRVQRSLSQGIAGKPVTLEADEFFAMGDNSTNSFDSRGWSQVDPALGDLPVGRENHDGVVPRRYLLGRAFFVYWPAGFRPMNGANDMLQPLDVPLVPNVGDMRFIR